MKQIAFLALSLLLVLPTQAATVTGTIIDNSGTALNGGIIRFRPTSNPAVLNTNISGGIQRSVTLSTNGYFSTALVQGNYAVTVNGYSWNISVPAGTDTYSIGDISAGVNNFPFTGLVKIDIADTEPEYLEEKLIAGPNISITETNASGDKALIISASGDADVSLKLDRTNGTATGLTLVGTNNVTPRHGTTAVAIEELLSGPFIDVRTLDVWPDGGDDTATLNAALATLATDLDNFTIAFNDGTYRLAGVNLPESCQVYIAPNAKIKALENYTTNIFNIKQGGTYRFFGGGEITHPDSIDDDQSPYAVIALSGAGSYSRTDRLIVDDVTFRGFARAAIANNNSTRFVNYDIRKSRFFDPYQFTDATSEVAAAIIHAAATANDNPHVSVVDCVFMAGGKTNRLSGGIVIANADSVGGRTSYFLDGIYMDYFGEAFGAKSAYKAIDIYQDGDKGIIQRFYITNTFGHHAIKVNNATHPQISYGSIHTHGAVGIGIVPGERTETESRWGGDISHVHVHGTNTTYAFYFYPGDSGTNLFPVSISYSSSTNVYNAVRMVGHNGDGVVADTFGPVDISHNNFQSTNNSTIVGFGIRGDVNIRNNGLWSYGGNAILFNQTNYTMNLSVFGNYLYADNDAIHAKGISHLTVGDNRIRATGSAIEVGADAEGTNVNSFIWHPDNKVISGSYDWTLSQITNVFVERIDGSAIWKNATANDRLVLRDDGTTPLLIYDTSAGTVRARGTSDALTTPFGVHNDSTGASAGSGMTVRSDTVSGGPSAFGLNYTALARRTGRSGFIGNSGNGLIFEAVTASSTIDWYAGSSTMGMRLSGSDLAVTGTASANTFSGAGGSLTLDASGFNGNLTPTDNTLQEVAQALDDLASVGDTDDQTAAEVPSTAAGDLDADDVQEALNELDTEKAPKASPTFTGTAIFGSASATPFILEGATADDFELTIGVTDPTADITATFPNRGGTVSLSGDTFTGDVTGTLDADGGTALAIADNVTVTGWALGASTATTPAAADNDTSLATTAFVQTEIDATQTGSHASPSTTNPLAPTWSGPVHTVWYGATGEIDLPAAASYSGRGILIYNTGAFTITVDPNGTEVIVREGTAQSAGISMTLSSGAGNFVWLFSDGTRWISLGKTGTLAVGS